MLLTVFSVGSRHLDQVGRRDDGRGQQAAAPAAQHRPGHHGRRRPDARDGLGAGGDHLRRVHPPGGEDRAGPRGPARSPTTASRAASGSRNMAAGPGRQHPEHGPGQPRPDHRARRGRRTPHARPAERDRAQDVDRPPERCHHRRAGRHLLRPHPPRGHRLAGRALVAGRRPVGGRRARRRRGPAVAADGSAEPAATRGRSGRRALQRCAPWPWPGPPATRRSFIDAA